MSVRRHASVDAPHAETAATYRDRLLASLGITPTAHASVPDEHPALAWAHSGLMALTGAADGAPQMCALPIASLADGALAALATLAPHADFSDLRGAQLLSERAALMNLQRSGRQSAGGACRLLDAADGQLALSLARDDDWSLLPAWLEDEAGDWAAVTGIVRTRSVDELVERGRELGLALAPSRDANDAALQWLQLLHGDPRFVPRQRHAPRVIDLSSLWAGPLCTHLLQRCGAEVIKLESTTRPDGARRGSIEFFDLLNAGKHSVVLDLRTPRGRAQLRELILQADIVIEASRPRALQQMGVDAETLLREKAELTWLSINGYGRHAPQAQWIAYGDDAGVAAGLSEVQRRATGTAMFVGDAIGDPLTGLHAALAAWASHAAGGGRLLSLALRDVVRHVAQFDHPGDDEALRERHSEWTRIAANEVRAPAARTACGAAAVLGADTERVLQELGIAC